MESHENSSMGAAPMQSSSQSEPAEATASPEAGSKGHGQDAHATTAVHDIAGIFPPMRDKEFEALVADMQEHGQFEPIWTYQGKVIDGRHRLKACRQLGMTPRTQEWDGEGSLLEFVIALNLKRRHLKETQRAMIAARMMPALEDAQSRRANWRAGRASDYAGKLLNVGRRSVERARKLLDSGCPELIDAVDHGRIAVSTAAALADRPHDKQKQLLEQGRKAIADALHPERTANVAASTPPPLAPAPPLLAGEGVGGRGEQQQRDAVLLQCFRAGCAKLSKNELGFRIEFTDNCLDELCKAVENREHFLELLKRGVWMVWKQSA